MDEAALLAAVRADPYSHTIRLVYADWLDEHGQSGRASIIRNQFTGETTMCLVVNPWDFVCLSESGQQTVCEDWFEVFVNFRWRARFRSPGLPRMRTDFNVRDEFLETREIEVRDRRGVTVVRRAIVTLATPHPKKWYTVEIAPV